MSSQKLTTSKSITAGLLLSASVLGVTSYSGVVSADEVVASSDSSSALVVPSVVGTSSEGSIATEDGLSVDSAISDSTKENSEMPSIAEGVTPSDSSSISENKTSVPNEGTPKVEDAPSSKDDSIKESLNEVHNSTPNDVPKEEVPPSGSNSSTSEKDNTSTEESDGKSESENPIEPAPPRFDFTVGGISNSVVEDKPITITLDRVTDFSNIGSSDVRYTQVVSNGTVLDLSKGILQPINSKLVATLNNSDGSPTSYDVANILGSTAYKVILSYSNAVNSVSYNLYKSQLLEGDELVGTYNLSVDGVNIKAIAVKDGNLGGVSSLLIPLSEGGHRFEFTGTTKYGVPTTGVLDVVIPKKEEPITPNPTPTPTPNPDPVPNPEPTPTPTPMPTPNPEPLPNQNNNSGGSGNNGNSGTTTPTVTPGNGGVVGDVPPITLPLPTGGDNNSNKQPQTPQTPQVPEVREPVRGVSDITVGGHSIYGDNSYNGVSSNGNTTTFTDIGRVDVRVNLDTSVVDSSRTELKLVGREQGELNFKDFVELKDGSYRIRGIAKDDFYTLTIKAYDRNGKLVTDTVETFSVNKAGSKYSLDNKNLQGSSVKNLKSDIKISETNVDKIETDKTKIRVYLNGKLVDLPKSAIKVTRTGGVSGKWKYTYTIDKSKFNKEGVYTVELSSESETGVKYSSASKTMQFTVDRTGAEISVSGVRDGGRYKSSIKRITIDIRDISKLKSVKAFVNGKEVELVYDPDTKLYYYDMKSTGNGKNELVVEVEDEAGNVSTQTVKDFYLSEDLAFSIFNDNNLYYLLGGIGALVVGFIGFLAIRRKRKLDEEDRLALEQAELLAASVSSDSDNKVNDFDSDTDKIRINLEDVLPASAEIASVDTSEVNDEEVVPLAEEVVSENQDLGSEDITETDVIVEDTESIETSETVSQDIQPTDIVEDVTSEDIEPTDVVEDGNIEDSNSTDVVEEDDVEDNTPTNII